MTYGLELPPLGEPCPHLVAEAYDPVCRRRLLHRLREDLDAGVTDPELLYLGGRYAASLGLAAEARRFLDPLSDMLREESPAPAWFPVGLLYLQILPAGEERDKMIAVLEQLANESTLFTAVLGRIGGAAVAQLVPGTANHQLAALYKKEDGPVATLLGNGDAVLRLVTERAAMATEQYRSGNLSAARFALEEILLVDYDHDGVLRNLIAVAGEQEEREAYERYWRRYIKVLLWRIMRADDEDHAWDELQRFYVQVALATEREFDHPKQKLPEILRRPGLLPRWLEAHAALVWLSSAMDSRIERQTAIDRNRLDEGRSGRFALMHFWFRCFYPEIAPYVESGIAVGHNGLLPGAQGQPAIAFDPAEKLLTRFALWSTLNFGLMEAEGDHAEAVVALAACAARVPSQPYIATLAELLNEEALEAKPFRRAMQEACSSALRLHLGRFLDTDDYKGLISFYGGEDVWENLLPELRLFVAYAMCKLDPPRPAEAFEIACSVVPEMEPTEFVEDAQPYSLWRTVYQTNISRIDSLKGKERTQGFEAIRKQLDAIPDVEAFRELRKQSVADILHRAVIKEAITKSQEFVESQEFEKAVAAVQELPEEPDEVAEIRQALMKQIREAEERWVVEQLTKEAVEEAKALVEKEDFHQARLVVGGLPGDREDIRTLKSSLLDQIKDAEESAKNHRIIDAAVKQSRNLVDKGQFDEARKKIRSLRGKTDDMKKLKEQLLEQIAEAENSARVERQVDKAVKSSQTLVNQGNFTEARRVIRELPDSPKDLKKLKKTLLSQIADAEKGANLHKEVERAIERSKKLVDSGNYSEAKDVIRALPGKDAELNKTKSNLLSQIGDIERKSKSTIAENARIFQWLMGHNVDVMRMAKDNNVNTANPFEFNGLLTAIEEHIKKER